MGRENKESKITLTTIFQSYINIWKGIKYAEYDLLFNIILFIPSCLLFTDCSLYTHIYKILILSASIELLQLIFNCGLFELCDIIDNTIGGIIGILICKARQYYQQNGYIIKSGN